MAIGGMPCRWWALQAPPRGAALRLGMRVQGMQLAELLFKDAVSRGRVADMETAVPVPAGLPPMALQVPTQEKGGQGRGGGSSKRRRQPEPGACTCLRVCALCAPQGLHSLLCSSWCPG